MYQSLRCWKTALGTSVGVLLLLLPATLPAQTVISADVSGVVKADEAGTARAKADKLLATKQIKHWSHAARLLEQAAAARADDDGAALEERLLAAELFHFKGSLARAQANLDAAAHQALADGRVFEAAQIMLKAASVAKERGNDVEAVAFARGAERLARSPHLTQAQCDCIRDAVVWLEPEKQIARR